MIYDTVVRALRQRLGVCENQRLGILVVAIALDLHLETFPQGVLNGLRTFQDQLSIYHGHYLPLQVVVR